MYYILYPYIIICTSCKLPKYSPYTPYKLDIKHLHLHKHCPCRPVVVVVVVVVVGNPPRPQKGGNHLSGGWAQGWAVVIPAHTYIYIYIYWLVVWNIFPCIGTFIIPTDFHIFQRGGWTTNQYTYVYDLFNNDLRPRLENVASAGNALGVPGQLPLGEYTCAAILPLNTYQFNVCIYIYINIFGSLFNNCLDIRIN